MSYKKLNLGKFEDNLIRFQKTVINTQWVVMFENGYGASIITGKGSYSNEEKPFELAVVVGEKTGEYHLCYDTDITSDVEGYLTNDDVLEYLERIMKL